MNDNEKASQGTNDLSSDKLAPDSNAIQPMVVSPSENVNKNTKKKITLGYVLFSGILLIVNVLIIIYTCQFLTGMVTIMTEPRDPASIAPLGFIMMPIVYASLVALPAIVSLVGLAIFVKKYRPIGKALIMYRILRYISVIAIISFVSVVFLASMIYFSK